MGIEYSAAIYVGLPREEITNQELLEDLIDEDTVSVCPPYYDGNEADYAIVGFELTSTGSYCPYEFVYDAEAVQNYKEEFKRLFGQDAKVWLSPYGY